MVGGLAVYIQNHGDELGVLVDQLLSGRQEIIVGANGQCSSYILEDSVFLANAFYGENLAGEWTVRLVDTNGDDLNLGELAVSNNTVPSVLEAVSVRAFGH